VCSREAGEGEERLVERGRDGELVKVKEEMIRTWWKEEKGGV
jgi:hypothetical protein